MAQYEGVGYDGVPGVPLYGGGLSKEGSLVTRMGQRVADMRSRFRRRDENMRLVRMIREGRMHEVQAMRDFFSDDLPRPVIANIVEVAARDLAEVMAPLPALACASGNGIATTDKKRAENKNRIGENYWLKSKLATQMFTFADHFNSYGFACFFVEPDFDNMTPKIRVEDPRGMYYLKDRWGNVTEVAKIWRMPVDQVVALFPEHKNVLVASKERTGPMGHGDAVTDLELVRYTHKDMGTTLFVSNRNNVVLRTADNCVPGVLPYFIVERPHLGELPTGQFDDVVWIQYARVIMSHYMFRATEEMVNAPTVLPRDVSALELGPGAVMYSDNPSKAHKLNLSVDPHIFQYGNSLDQEVKAGARYPDARSGSVKSSVVTGRGVEALLGTFDSQVKTAQELFKPVLQDATSYCMALDVKYWPDTRKTIEGVLSSQSFKMSYVPARDIADDTSVIVTYGFLAGQSPAQAALMLLQLKSAELVSDDTTRHHLPFDLNSELEQRKIDAERMDKALLSGLAAYSQSLGVLLQQGQSAEKVLTPIARIVALRQGGSPLHEAMLKAFKEADEQEQQKQQAQAPPPGVPQQGGPGPGEEPSGLLKGVAPGQAGMPPGGMPSIEKTIAGLRGAGAQPNMEAQVVNRQAIGG